MSAAPEVTATELHDRFLKTYRYLRMAMAGMLVMLAAGVFLPTSCERGVCGTCLTPVLQGRPEHHDQYLTPEEQAAGDQFTPCCSRAIDEQLVIDL